ncbi:hypothetical protein F0Q45_08325 [Mycobacterium simiae]|uniref:Uncharacterized protein n=1 Tax=Mycobacterium simiae TaxID=1784 RepID=A0A5B1BTA6_MYCSI|nr:hypothetical protein [Mycobacterium simiae]KAA1250690.1 hypothetical protein F0Q45_08325 [Mycobacterium simiae]
MTTQPLSLPRPAAAIREHALRCAEMRSHRAQVSAWLRATDVTTVEQLFDALGGRDTASTAVLLADHRRGVALASTVLLGAKAVMLSSVARHAPGDSVDERFQATVDAFLSRALPAVKPTHKFADAQLYWITLRTVTKQHEAPVCVAEPSFDDVVGDDVCAEVDGYLTADVLLDWALRRGVLAEQDHRALKIRFGGDSALSVREVAAVLGVTENKLESRLRRAMGRLRDAVIAARDDLDRACIEARWSRVGDAIGAVTLAETGVAA